MVFTEENDCVGQMELPGMIVLFQGSNWASTIFQKLAGRGRSGRDTPGARSLEDGSNEYGPGRQPAGDIACMLCCSSFAELTENRPESKSLPGGTQQGKERFGKSP